jgi:hypothetical protein
MKAILLFAFLFLAYTGSNLGVTDSFKIDSPKECPENLRVETQPSRDHEGLVLVSVLFTPTAPELYRDRVKAFGELVVKNEDKTIAVSNLASTQKAGVFRFTFQLARDAFHHSELTLSSQLYEKDGRATIGGGEVYRLNLKGFQPDEQSTQTDLGRGK